MAQKALENAEVITLSHPDDQLVLVSDGCNSPAAVDRILYIIGDEGCVESGSVKRGMNKMAWRGMIN